MLVDQRFAQYDYDQQGSVAAGTRLNFFTNSNTAPNGSYVSRTFTPSCYPPGTWPAGVFQRQSESGPVTVMPPGDGI